MTPAAETRIEAKIDELLATVAGMKRDVRHGAETLIDHEIRLRAEESRGRYSPTQIAVAIGVIIGTTAATAGTAVTIAMNLMH